MASLYKRDNSYYVQYYVGKKKVRRNLHTSSKKMAEEKMRMVESALFRDVDIPLPMVEGAKRLRLPGMRREKR